MLVMNYKFICECGPSVKKCDEEPMQNLIMMSLILVTDIDACTRNIKKPYLNLLSLSKMKLNIFTRLVRPRVRFRVSRGKDSHSYIIIVPIYRKY